MADKENKINAKKVELKTISKQKGKQNVLAAAQGETTANISADEAVKI